MSRPKGINDLQVLWAIRDISSDLITFEERGLLWALLSIIGNRESTWYSIDQLSKLLGCSSRFLQYKFKSLEKLNLIQVKRPSCNGRGYANEYSLNYYEILDQQKGAQNAPISKEKGASDAPLTEKRVHQAFQKGAPRAYQDIHPDIQKEKRGASRDVHTSSQNQKPDQKPEPDYHSAEQTQHNRDMMKMIMGRMRSGPNGQSPPSHETLQKQKLKELEAKLKAEGKLQ
jgi:AraC-like DNA-binding protein